MSDMETRLFINGQYRQSSSGETITIYNPSDDSLVSDKVQVAAEKDIDDAVVAARAAFPKWRDAKAWKRAACMLKFADLLERDMEKLAKLESAAMGQPITIAKAMIQRPIDLWRYYAGHAGKVAGQTFPPDEDGFYKIVQYEPLGVCAGITAWNGTHVLAAWKMAPAMAAGNCFILKTSEKSPIAACHYGNLLNEAGFPPGVINIVTGAGPVGAMLSSHMGIDKVSFTGSATAGRAVLAAAAKSNMKQVTLELGGKSPAIVFDDAELDNCVQHTSYGFLRNSGQVCLASSRVLVQEGIAEKYIEKVKQAMTDAEKTMGDPSLDKTAFGPLADKKQFDRVMSFLESARQEGTDIPVGGGRQGSKGAFVQPTILMNPDTNSKAYKEEIFGPVLAIRTFKTEEEALKLANDTTYGLSSTIYTSDIARALRVAGAIEAGTVGINGAYGPLPQTPFGGFKQSGLGRESGVQGLMAYVQPKTIHVNMAAGKK